MIDVQRCARHAIMSAAVCDSTLMKYSLFTSRLVSSTKAWTHGGLFCKLKSGTLQA